MRESVCAVPAAKAKKACRTVLQASVFFILLRFFR